MASWSSNALKVLGNSLALIATLATIYSVWLQFRSNKPSLLVSYNNIDHLTDLPQVTGLKALYTFKNDTISDLWKVNFTVSNNGKQTLIATGAHSNIMHKALPIVIGSKFKIVDATIKTHSLPIQTKVVGDTIFLHFEQWRSDEAVEIDLYLEKINRRDSSTPSLNLSDREIEDGKVLYAKQSNNIDKKSTRTVLADYITEPFKTILLIICIAFYGTVAAILPVGLAIEIDSFLYYKSWSKKHYSNYSDFVKEMVQIGKINKLVEPNELPTHLWRLFSGVKPDKASSTRFMPLAIGLIAGFIIAVGPLLWMISKFW